MLRRECWAQALWSDRTKLFARFGAEPKTTGRTGSQSLDVSLKQERLKAGTASENNETAVRQVRGCPFKLPFRVYRNPVWYLPLPCSCHSDPQSPASADSQSVVMIPTPLSATLLLSWQSALGSPLFPWKPTFSCVRSARHVRLLDYLSGRLESGSAFIRRCTTRLRLVRGSWTQLSS